MNALPIDCAASTRTAVVTTRIAAAAIVLVVGLVSAQAMMPAAPLAANPAATTAVAPAAVVKSGLAQR